MYYQQKNKQKKTQFYWLDFCQCLLPGSRCGSKRLKYYISSGILPMKICSQFLMIECKIGKVKADLLFYLMKWPDKYTTSYALLDFESSIKNCSGHIG